MKPKYADESRLVESEVASVKENEQRQLFAC